MKKIIKFSSLNCMPCKALAPAFDKLKESFKGTEVKFHDVDVETHPEEADKYKVRTVPTVIFLNNDVEIMRLVGLNNKKDYIENINKLLTI